MQKVIYLCDGNVKDCNKKHCYKWGGDGSCRYTSNIENAENFERQKETDIYVEKNVTSTNHPT